LALLERSKNDTKRVEKEVAIRMIASYLRFILPLGRTYSFSLTFGFAM